MSGPDRDNAERRRRRKGARWRADEVYASIPLDWLQAAVVGLSPIALRVWILANANWAPSREGGRGQAALGYAMIRHPLGAGHKTAQQEQPGRSAIAAAVREAQAKGFLELAVAGSRPSRAGGSRGKAAQYFVPCREGHLRPPAILGTNGRMGGKLRLHCAFLRALVAGLSPNALSLLAHLLSLRPRDREGRLLDQRTMSLASTEVAGALGMPRSTAAAGLRSLVAAGHLRVEVQGAGRAAAQYGFSRVFLAHSRLPSPAPDRPTAKSQPIAST